MTEGSIEVSQVVQAIQTLYDPSTPPTVQTQIQQHLQRVQQSFQSWGLINPLLSYPQDDIVGLRFFAASTLEYKVTRQWETITSKGDKNRLKEDILNWLSQSAVRAYPPGGVGRGKGEEKPVLRKLASCVTALSIKLQPSSNTTTRRSGGRSEVEEEEEEDEGWQDWLLQVIVRISASGAEREAVLEVLEVAIQQVARAELTGSKRMAYMSSLTSSTPHLVSTLTQSLSSSTSSSETNRALSCFTSFLSAGQLSHQHLETLYPYLTRHLFNTETCIEVCGAVEEIVERSSGLTSSGGSGVTKFMNRMRSEELIRQWTCSKFVQEMTENAVQESKEGSDDVDGEVLAVFKLICTLSEHFISNYLFDPPPALSSTSSSSTIQPHLSLVSPETHTLLSLLLTLTTYPGHSPDSSYTVNELPTGTWMALQEYGAEEGFVVGGGGTNGREGEWTVYKEVWKALASGLRERAVRPSEGEFESWPKDIKDAFRVYRSTVLFDPIQYAYYVLRDEMLATLVELASHQVQDPPSASTSVRDGYEQLEATLFTINCLSECVPMSIPSNLPSLSDSISSSTSTNSANNTNSTTTTCLSYLFGPSILGSLPREPSLHLTLRSTALKLVGSYSPWFSSHPAACLDSLQFVITALTQRDPLLVPPAARALRGLCDSNRKVLTGHVGDFVRVLIELEGTVEEGEFAKVLESVASVVQALEPNQTIEPLLTLANPIISKLQAATQGQASTIEEARLSTLQQLSYLSSLSKGLSPPEPDVLDLDTSYDDTIARDAALSVVGDERVGEMRLRLGQAVENSARVWAGDVEIVSALSDFIRNSTADSIPSPISLDPLLLLSLCSQALQVSPSSIWLGIAGSLLARLARDRNDRSLQGDELARVGTPVEGMLNVVLTTYSDLNAMSENPDVVAAFLSFCSQIVRHYPSIFVVLPAHYLDAVLAFAERGLGMQEQFSLKSTIELLLSSVQQTKMASSSSETFASTLTPRVPSLLRSTLIAICGAIPRSHLVALSELLHACLLRTPEQARPAMKELLNTPGWPNARTSDEVKAKFERSVLSARTGRQVRQAVNDFALIARGIDGAYGAATEL